MSRSSSGCTHCISCTSDRSQLICSSALGHDAALQQIDLIPFILESGVKLFIPTDLALPYTEEERESVKIPRDKEVVEKALTREGVPYVTILAGNFAEFALGTP